VYENNVILRTDRPTDRRPTRRPTDLAFCKISNGHNSATGHPIHFMFGSMVGFSSSADLMDLLPVGANPRWRLAGHLGKFQMAISPERVVRSTSRLIYRVGFSGTADRMDLLPVAPNPRRRLVAILENFE